MTRRVVALLTLAVALLAAIPVPRAEAATFTVDRTDDPAGAGACTGAANDCSLRQAILRANATVGLDTISLAAGNTYTLALTGANEDAAATGDLDITQPLIFSISGTGLASVTAPVSWDDRIVDVRAAVTMTRIEISRGNVTGQTGGGVRVTSTGTLTATQMDFVRNTSSVTGGALDVQTGGSTTIQQSLFRTNQATQGGGAIQSTGTLNLYRSTVASNDTNADGGGLRVAGGTTTLDRVTIANNEADADGDNNGNGGGVRMNSGTLNVRNTIIATNIDSGHQAEDCSGAVTSQGRNLLHRTAGCSFSSSTGDILNQNPLLGALSGNGFGIPSFSLLAGSPAIDAGDPTSSCIDDQRALAEVDGNGDGKATCDIGAYEEQTAGASVTTITVSKTEDTADGECSAFDCSLREAVSAANRVTGPQAITLPAGTYTITLALLSDEEFNASDDFDLLDTTGATTITGPGGAATTIIQSSGTAGRLFDIETGVTVNLTGLTLRNGNVVSTEGSDGGGIVNRGTLSLDRVMLSANIAEGAGGGILNTGGATLTIDRSTITGNVASGAGGGIANLGTLTIRNSTLSDNRTQLSGGGIGVTTGTATLQNVTVTTNVSDIDNNATGAGGGIAASAGTTVNLINTIVAGNRGNGLGSLLSDCSGVLTSQGHNILGTTANCTFALQPGDLVSSSVSLGPLQDNGGPTPTHAPFTSSVAIDGGDNAAPTCMGGSFDQRGTGFARTVDGNGDGKATCDIGALEVQTTLAPPGTLNVTTTADSNDDECSASHCSLREAVRAANRLAGQQVVQVPPGTFVLSLPGNDDTAAAGDLDLTDSINIAGVSAASTIVDGGGIDRVFQITAAGINVVIQRLAITGGDSGGPGGGIDNGGNLGLINVEVFGNAAVGGGGINVGPGASLALNAVTVRDNDVTAAGAGGGGIMSAGTLTATNSTISGNDAHTHGGGLFVTNGSVSLTNVTIAANTIQTGDGGGLLRSGGTVSLRNTLISDNLVTPATNNDCEGAITSQGNNLIRANFCAGTVGSDLLNQAANIATLGSNGGFTSTHALNSGSPAIDAASAVGCPSFDQRGQPRPQDGNGDTTAQCDIGAFEAISVNPPVIQFQLANVNVTEGTTILGVVLTRTCPCSVDSSVQIASTNGSAVAGSDFDAVSDTVTFTGTQALETYDVTLVNDALVEPTQSFTLTLSNPVGAVLGALTTVAVNISDNDPQDGIVVFSSSTYQVDETQAAVTITIQRTGNTDGVTTVDYTTNSLTANAGSDFTAASGTITFTDGQSEGTFQVPIINDVEIEAAEAFGLLLTNPVGGVLGGQPTASVTINSEDIPNLATLTGAITLQGRTPTSPGNLPHIRPGFGSGTVEVRLAGGPAVFQGFVQEDGSFSVANLTPGSYDLVAAAPGYLTAQKLNFNVVPGTPNAGTIQLRAGRVTPDATVNIVDITTLIAAFGLVTSDRGDGLGNIVDLNGDGVVNIQDITLTLGNFGRVEPLAWP